MNRIALLLCLAVLATACSPTGSGHEGNVWLPRGHAAAAAQDAWGLALAFEPTVELMPTAEIRKLCPPLYPGDLASACTDYSAHAIYLPNDVDEPTRAAFLLHEIGHVIRPELPHLTAECAGVDGATASLHVMCATSSGLLAPTDADLDWALGAAVAP